MDYKARKPRVLIMTPGILPVPAVRGGAVEKLITDLIDENELRNVLDITLVTISDTAIVPDKYSNTKIFQVKMTGFYKLADKILDKLQRMLHVSRAVRLFDRCIMRRLKAENDISKFDIIIAENMAGLAGTLVTEVKKTKGPAKIFFHIHNNIDMYRSPSEIRRLKENGVVFITVSRYIRDEIIKIVPDANADVLYNGIDTKIIGRDTAIGKKYSCEINGTFTEGVLERKKGKQSEEVFKEKNGVQPKEVFKERYGEQPKEVFKEKYGKQTKEILREKYGICETATVILYSGRIIAEKGVLELVKAFTAHKLRKPDSNLFLALAGMKKSEPDDQGSSRDNEEMTKYEKSVQDELLKAPNSIRPLGKRPYEQMSEIYALADVLAVPTMDNEAFGMVVLEGMAMGLPIITTSSGGIPEILEDGKGSIKVSKENICEELANVFDRLGEEDSRADLKEMGAHNLRIFLNKDGVRKEDYFERFLSIIGIGPEGKEQL